MRDTGFRALVRFDSLSNVVMLYANFFPDPHYQAMRNCIGHYGIAAVYLLAANCREVEVLPQLAASGLITEEEVSSTATGCA